MGERTFTLEVVSGRAGPCACLDDYRICGPKPWGSGSVVHKWTVRESDLRRAMKDAPALPDASGKLREALEKHDAFIRELTADFIGSFDGAELQDMLVKHGLYRIEPFDPKVHDDSSGAAEPGDDFYVPTNIARTALSETPSSDTTRSTRE